MTGITRRAALGLLAGGGALVGLGLAGGYLLLALLQAHVSSMYTHLNQRAEVTCMSSSLPTLFRNSTSYRRELTTTAKGVVVTETSTDPRITSAIRDHAQEVSGFVHDGMPAMMRGMMGR